MQSLHAVTALGFALCATAAVSAHQPPPGTEELRTTLKPKVVKSWSYALPAESWKKVGNSIDLPHEGGRGFLAAKHPTALKLELDCDGDGDGDKTIRGADGFAILELDLDGEKVPYALRLRAAGADYEFAASTVLVGRIGGSDITLIDQDNDGDFTEFGVDAIVVGKRRAASYLSHVVSLDDGLYELQLDGRELVAKAFQGETGAVNLATGFKARAKLECLVISDENGNSYEVSHERSGLRVPVGKYKITGGQVSKGQETVSIRAGKMGAIEVTADGEAELEWGGPLVAEVSFTRQADQVKIGPENLHFFGKAGEEYYNFHPDGASPKFSIRDKDSGREVGKLRFEGC